jgi:ABC-2 type transport system permease protein
MRHLIAIARRELGSYFVSPIAYAAVAVFTFVSGVFFSNMLTYYVRTSAQLDGQLQKTGRSEFQIDVPTQVLGDFFRNEAFVLLLVVPLLTMGLITEERRKGTLELLVTSPVRAWEVIAGKFVGAFGLGALMLLFTMPMMVFLIQGGEWEPGIVASGYLGLLLLIGVQVAFGLFISSLCESVLVSAIGTYGLLATLSFLDSGSSSTNPYWDNVVNYLSLGLHHQNSTRGLIAVVDVTFFLSMIGLGLFLAQRSVESIRFKRS